MISRARISRTVRDPEAIIGSINIVIRAMEAAMETQALDYPADDDDMTAHRERAKAELDQIAQRARQAIDIPLFFLLPNSGDAILIFGTPGDPPDDQWDRVGEIVASIVAQACGLHGTRRREVACAGTHDQESYDAVA
jgi:hypothetical protein